MAKRSHYNPCFWTAIWNREYFTKFISGNHATLCARKQIVTVLNARSNKTYPTTVERVHVHKGIGEALITEESLKSFYKRHFPRDYENKELHVTGPLILDVENFLTGLEMAARYNRLLKLAREERIESVEDKGFLAGMFVIHAMRSFEMFTTSLRYASLIGVSKWEYMLLLKRWLEEPNTLMRPIAPLALSRWTLYRNSSHRFPLCDSPVMINRDSVMVTISPFLLLEIDMRITDTPENWRIQEINFSKFQEFRRRSIKSTFNEIIFSNEAELQSWRKTKEFKKRIRTLADSDERKAALLEATHWILWALKGFGRVPPEFETWVKPFTE